jgi:CheY-like chemotaxis protein
MAHYPFYTHNLSLVGVCVKRIGKDQSLSKNEVVDNIVLEIKLDLANANTQSILYIEDNPSNLALMEAVIARIPKLAMLSAPNAETGLDMAKSHLPDLILMDINLPGMDGVEALNKLRSQDKTKNIPVIALTAAAMPHEIERGIEAGFEQYVTKPIKITEVLDAFNRYLN